MNLSYKYEWSGAINIGSLVGGVAVEVSRNEDGITLKMSGGELICLMHEQDCCESVYLDDVCGDLQDLVGSPILVAEEVEGTTTLDPAEGHYEGDSYTWTFYKLDTAKGGVVARWFGSSNGYYSESVDVVHTNRKREVV
jgi:hypothetical protein